MANLASHVVDLFEAGRTEDIHLAFELTEQLIESGSEKERHAAIVGFLETVQNVASHRIFGASAFEGFLGPKSRLAWAKLNDAWKDKTTLAEVVASETGAGLRPRWSMDMLKEVENPELRKIIEQITREDLHKQ